MNKKMLATLLVAVFALAGCGEKTNDITDNSGTTGNSVVEESQPSSFHEHTFASSWSNDDIYHWHASTCGHDITSDKEEHAFKDEVVTATYEAEGYTAHTCTVCGYSYKDSYTDKLEHAYSNDWSFDAASHWHVCTDEGYGKLTKDFASHEFQEAITEPTYESEGYTTHTCAICGYSYNDDYTDPLVRTYTITWENWDGTILETDVVEEGQTPKYDGNTPTKSEDETYTYAFKGWSPEIKAAESDQTYVATFTNEKIKYVISFDLNGGSSSSYEGSKTVEAFDTNVFFFDLEKEECNFRGWSYNGQKVFDETGKLYFTPKMEKEMTFIAIFEQNVRMYVYTNMPEAGSITGDGYYPFNTYVDISAHPYQGYKFVGWYYQGTFGWNYTSDLNVLLSNTEDYKYMMWDKDVRIEARFALDSFEIKLHSNDEDYGLVLLKPLSQNVDDVYLSSYSEEREYKSKVTIAAYSKSDVRFLGWYDDDGKLVTTNGVYIFNMPNYDYSLQAKWNHFKIEYNLNGGVNDESNPTEYTIDDDPITLNAPTKTGYTFLGWKKDGEFVNSIDPNWANHVTLDAIWEATTFSITYHLDGGTNSDENPASYTIENKDIILSSPAKNGYDFAGWYLDRDFKKKIDKILGGTYGDINVYAKWETIEYSITYKLDGGTNSENNPSTYTVEDEIMLEDAVSTKDGYSFDGWYLNGDRIESIVRGTTGDLIIEARWSADLQALDVSSDDESKGTAEIVSGKGRTDETITVKATPAEGYIFKGWYENGKRVSAYETYTFTMPARGVSLTAQFWTEGEKERAPSLGITPVFDSKSNTVTYGLYPQTHVSDEDLISSLNELTDAESNGWYLYDGSYYAKKAATPYSSGCEFDDETTIVEGTEYWFKCEPIKWNILSSSDGTYSLVSSALLDAHRYYSSTSDRTIDGETVYANNYEHSDIRSWLNGDFYDSAFALDDFLIQTVTVNNSAATTGSSTNKYACNDTQDKVYLLSYQDYENVDYFPNKASRCCKPTDLAKANGAYYSHDGSNYDGSGDYWTRSPSFDSSRYAWSVSYDGRLGYDSVYRSLTCVRPSLQIKVA